MNHVSRSIPEGTLLSETVSRRVLTMPGHIWIRLRVAGRIKTSRPQPTFLSVSDMQKQNIQSFAIAMIVHGIALTVLYVMKIALPAEKFRLARFLRLDMGA